jgi:hypothetical protein
MKNQHLFIILIAVTLQFASAQYVETPDTTFRTYLIKQFPTCFNGFNFMDTTCGQIITTKWLSVDFVTSAKTNNNIEGIQYFDNVETISVYGNGLNWVSSKFPPKLKSFRCELGYLTYLPPLPDSLEYLDIVGNEVTILPELPKKLKHLYVHKNHLSEIPELPSSLKTLDILANNISSLPILPAVLETLWVGANPIQCLSELHDSL